RATHVKGIEPQLLRDSGAVWIVDPRSYYRLLLPVIQLSSQGLRGLHCDGRAPARVISLSQRNGLRTKGISPLFIGRMNRCAKQAPKYDFAIGIMWKTGSGCWNAGKWI